MSFYQTKEFRKEQEKWYGKLREQGFYDIESGLDSPPMLKPHHRGLNAVHSRTGKALPGKLGEIRGDEWEQLLSDENLHADLGDDGKARYMHYALLAAAQAYETGYGGPYVTASQKRAAWALHAQGVSERDIAGYLGVTRYFVTGYVKELQEVIERAVARDADGCYTVSRGKDD